MNTLIDLFKVLSDETRIRILNLINEHELCVCELTEILDLPQPKISKHIAKIRNANLVETKRNEQYIYYSLRKENKELEDLLNVISKKNNKVLENDLAKLRAKNSFVCTNEVE